MSKFQVEVKTISKVIKHPNADRLTIYVLNDLNYQMISNVKYEIGDQVVYFPIDSVMTPELIELFELGTMLAGKQHNRVKTVKLRGEYSQGFIADVESVAKFLKVPAAQLPLMDLTEVLGIVKWEPEPVSCKNGDLVALPPGNSMYDIEGCDNFPNVIQKIIDEKIPVMITEKLEGQNFSVTVNSEGEEWVSQRRFSIKEKEGGEHDMWEVARREKIIEFAHNIRQEEGAESVTIYGEHCGPGVQGNYYQLSNRTVFFFDMKINGKWVDATKFLEIIVRHNRFEDNTVPVLARDVLLDEWLDGKPVNEASYGKSCINKHKLREGIVIKPMTEMTVESFGRLLIKQRDRTYLDKTGN